MLHSKTRVVKTYGKQHSRVVNVHQDFQEALNETLIQRKAETVNAFTLDDAENGIKSSPAKGQRPPLATKISHAQTTNLESDDSFEVVLLKSQKPSKDFKKSSNKNPIADLGVKRINKPKPPKLLKSTAQVIRDNVSIPSPSFSDKIAVSTPASTSASYSPPSPISISSDESSLSQPAPRNTTTRKTAGKKAARRRIISLSSNESMEVVESLRDKKKTEADEVVLLSKRFSKLKTVEALNEEAYTGVGQEPLEALLNFCHQSKPTLFTSFLETHDFLPLGHVVENPKKAPSRTAGRRKAAVDEICEPSYTITKLGEASYSEVYSVSRVDGPHEDVVLKVVPLISPSTGKVALKDADEEIFTSAADDVLRELEVTKLMSEMRVGFVEFRGAFVVRGTYPERLLDAWDEFEDEKGSESIRPDDLAEEQLYAIILLSNGGTDLEHFEFDQKHGWQQAFSVTSQIFKAVALAEDEVAFEHRDLHEGQVLIRHADDSALTSWEPQATIVDFGLSRVHDSRSDDVHWTQIPEDVYDGVGEQWDVYRRTRSHVEEIGGGDWSRFYPLTNVMWLHHLLRILLFSTPSLCKPKSPAVAKTLKARAASSALPTRVSTRATADGDTQASEYSYYKYISNLELLLRSSVGFAPTTRRSKVRGMQRDKPEAVQFTSAKALQRWCETNQLA